MPFQTDLTYTHVTCKFFFYLVTSNNRQRINQKRLTNFKTPFWGQLKTMYPCIVRQFLVAPCCKRQGKYKNSGAIYTFLRQPCPKLRPVKVRQLVNCDRPTIWPGMSQKQFLSVIIFTVVDLSNDEISESCPFNFLFKIGRNILYPTKPYQIL